MEQIIRYIDTGAHRLLTWNAVTRSPCRQPETVLQTIEYLLYREGADMGCSQFDSQWDAVKAATEFYKQRRLCLRQLDIRVYLPGTIEKESGRIIVPQVLNRNVLIGFGKGEGRNAEALFPQHI